MADFEAAVQLVLADEGALTDNLVTDPNGGLTNFGISQKQNPDVDVAHLTREAAIAIYRARYWDTLKCYALSWPLDFLVFDAAVNQGQMTTARMLQTAVSVPVDGNIGPVTLAAIISRDPWELTARFCALRLKSYVGTDGYQANGEGWFYRVAKNLLAAGHSRS